MLRTLLKAVFAASMIAAFTACQPKFAYVANSTDNTISGYTVNKVTGELTPIPGSPYTAGDGPGSVIVTPSGKFVYAANEVSNNVSAYSINQATGALTPVSGSPFTAGSGPHSVTVDLSDQYLYVTNEGSNNVSGFRINPGTGALTAVSGSPFPTGKQPSSAAEATGSFLYVTNATIGSPAGSISGFSVNNATGALTPIAGSPFPAGAEPFSIAVSLLAGTNAYVANFVDNSLSGYTVNTGTGALTPVSGSPFTVGSRPFSVAVDILGRFVYVANSAATVSVNGNGNISAFAISENGSLTAIAGSPFTAGKNPFSVTVDASGAFAYTANNGDDTVSGFSINSTTGALTPVVGNPFSAGTGPVSVITTPGS